MYDLGRHPIMSLLKVFAFIYITKKYCAHISAW